ncbi:putative F-box/LRR-repeat protein 9 [Aegilops tauschii subsp. strangulata]|uniref:putative F-box/LRR-repeat protein 9 n=1 Tax=Aegilops tauschii subsp. strangulata TaxID=200361 RepID=UPI001E1CAD8C|nr:F-box protein SKIP19-like [Aegilops tauschii subsp. strangulata]
MELQLDAPPALLPSVRDWSELPLDALTLVFKGLDAVDLLMGAGLVCHSWLEAAKAPELWRKVDMGRGPRDKEVMEKNRGVDLDHSNRGVGFAIRIPGKNNLSKSTQVMCAMAKVAVDRSDGKMEVFVGSNFVTDEILNYIGARYSSSYHRSVCTEQIIVPHQFCNRTYLISSRYLLYLLCRSPSLKGLALLSCYHVTSQGFTDLVSKCPLLEDIELSGCIGVSGDAMVATGRACLRLKRLVLDKTWTRRWDRGEVAGISMMHELRHLSLSRSDITNEELMAVVYACPCLEQLSVADCYNIVADNALRAKCATVKTLGLPASQDHHYDWDEFYAYGFGTASYHGDIGYGWMSNDRYASNGPYDYEFGTASYDHDIDYGWMPDD